MSRLSELIAELCPKGVEYKKFVDCCSYIRGVTYSKSQEIHDSIDGWKVLRANNIVLGSYKVNYDDVKIIPFIKKDIV